MNTFKEFFKANHDYSVFLEMAYREHVVKRPVSIDNEDIDFLYQVDQKDWPDALDKRYDVLYKSLENRDKVRTNVKKELFKQLEKAFGKKKLAGIRDKDFKNKFKQLVLDFASKYNDYGDAGPGEFNIIKLKDWLDNDLENYDLETKISEIGYRNSDVKNAFKDFVYYIVDAIVPFAKEGKEQFEDTFINFYINRLIQKLETTKGKNYIVPNSNPYSPTNLPNIKSVLPSEVSKKIKLRSSGEYGFDLSGVEETSRSGEKRIGSKSFAFPSSPGKKVRDLLALNFHRHLGPLPSDENPSSFDGLAAEGKFKYKIARSHNVSKTSSHDQKPRLKDNYILDKKAQGLKNSISKILTKAQSLNYKNWDDPKLIDLWEIIGRSDEVTDGSWFDNAGLNNDEDLKNIFGKKETGVYETRINPNTNESEKHELLAWQLAKREKWFSELKTTKGGGVAGNSRLKEKFSEYFSRLVATKIFSSSKQLSPQILSDKETEEFSDDGHPRIDKEELDQIKKSLTPEQFDVFKKTGRFPYSLNQDKKNPEITIGKNPKNGKHEPGFMMLPTIKHTVDIIDKDGNKIGEKIIHLPVINGSRFIKATPSPLKKSKISDEDEDSDDEDSDDEDSDSEQDSNSGYSKPITTTRGSSEVKSIEEIDKIYYKNPEKYKGTELEVAVKAYRDPDSGGIYTYNGKTKNVLDGFVFDDIYNKMYPIDTYQHGPAGVTGVHFRQEDSGKRPETGVLRTTRRKISGIFGQIKDAKGLTPALTRLGYGRKVGLFSEKPMDEYKQMRWTGFKIERFGNKKRSSEEEIESDGVNKQEKISSITQTNSGDSEIEGYYDIITGISQCLLNKGAQACGTGVDASVKNTLLNDVNLILKAHDFILDALINNVSNKDYKTSVSRIKFANSELGKVLQKPTFGQESRKNRKEVANLDTSNVDTELHPFRKDSAEEEDPNSNKPKRDLIEDRFIETIFDFPGKENQANKLSKGDREKTIEILSGLLEDPEQGVAANLNTYSGLTQELDGYEKISEEAKNRLLDKINKQKNQLLEYLSRVKMGPISSRTRKEIVEYYYKQMERKLNKIPVISPAASEKPQITEMEREKKVEYVFSLIKEIASKRMLELPTSEELISRNNLNPEERELMIRKSAEEIFRSLYSLSTYDKINSFIKIKNSTIDVRINRFNFICDSLIKLDLISRASPELKNNMKNNIKKVWEDLSKQNNEIKGTGIPMPIFIIN